jgi:hypothetical protein
LKWHTGILPTLDLTFDFLRVYLVLWRIWSVLLFCLARQLGHFGECFHIVHMNTALLCTYNGILKFFRGLVNDTYKMDLILIYPPYMIALACIYIASVLKDKDTTAWFEELRVDMNVVRQTASPNPGHYILYLY